MKTREKRDPQWATLRVCKCGRSCIGETGRLLAVRLREHRHNIKSVSYRKIKIKVS
jgi:hypothetical protein